MNLSDLPVAINYSCAKKGYEKARFTYIPLTAKYTASATLCVKDMAVVQPMPQLKPALTVFGMRPYSRT